MNLFFSSDTIMDSVRDLDDRRLMKQILECQTLLRISLGEQSGYANHPVAVYYAKHPLFLANYGLYACIEYSNRFGKTHKLESDFANVWFNYLVDVSKVYEIVPPIYVEGSKKDKNCIRTTENVQELFRNKLKNKWRYDKYPPKWTLVGAPKWLKGV